MKSILERLKMKENSEEKSAKKIVVGIKFMRMLTTIVVAIAVIVACVTVRSMVGRDRITSAFISDKLEEMSELTSAQLTFNGFLPYSDGNIPVINKKAFLMVYRAEIEAGIDLSQVDVDVNKSRVKLMLPQIDILDIHVDSTSIQFYDEKFALFNWSGKEDVIKAIQLAEEDIKNRDEVEELKAKAKEQTETVLTALFEELIGDRILEITYK